MTARHWHRRCAATLDVEYIPELPPTEFSDYRYWLARKAGWERLAPLCHWPRIVVNETDWQWWLDQTRSTQLYIARLGISRIISGEVEIEEPVLDRMFNGNCVVEKKNMTPKIGAT